MQQRFLYLWFADLAFACQRLTKPSLDADKPFATTLSDHRGSYLCGLNPSSRAAGLASGQRLSDARAIMPDLITMTADCDAESAYLHKLAQIGESFSPWVAMDGPHHHLGMGGLWLDMSGAAHLFGGEKKLMIKVQERYTPLITPLRLGLADTALAAWAAARFHKGDGRLEEGQMRTETDAFPLEALDIETDLIQRLNRLGFRSLKDLRQVPRANLTTRFGPILLERLDRMNAQHSRSLSYLSETRFFEQKQFFADPLGSQDIIRDTILSMLNALCGDIREAGRGVRALAIRFQRVDASLFHVNINTSAPVQDVTALMRLLDNRLPGVDPGFGVEYIHMRALDTQWIKQSQHSLTPNAKTDSTEQQGLNNLIDRLRQRLGDQALSYPHFHPSHLPERVVRHTLTPNDQTTPPLVAERPIRLLRPPEPVNLDQQDTLGRPLLFKWRRQMIEVCDIQGPERLSREWWRKLDLDLWDACLGLRDYYRLRDQKGRDLWVCQSFSTPASSKWYVHGWFA